MPEFRLAGSAQEKPSVIAFIGLGSNLEQPEKQIRQAIPALDRLPQTRLIRCSALYRGPPMGPKDQPDYINAVAMVETSLQPEALLVELQGIEQQQGRVRERRWGPRTLDLDLLLYGDRVIDTPLLKVPHPGMHERPFVLHPLREIAPDQEIPGRGTILSLVENCPADDLKRV
jgi:2-amino-4-hydroxy-6-hydroxymethyldihydropteridine diphosphokinase